jgi:hypothetical protein
MIIQDVSGMMVITHAHIQEMALVHWRKRMSDPRYVEPGDEFGDGNSWNPRARPKWMKPETDLEKRILRSVGRKYYPDKYLKTEVRLIVKAAISLDEGIESEYPTEWIEYCCEWAEGKRAKGSMVQLKGLLTFINREEAKQSFLDRYEKEYEPMDDDLEYDFFYDEED